MAKAQENSLSSVKNGKNPGKIYKAWPMMIKAQNYPSILAKNGKISGNISQI